MREDAVGTLMFGGVEHGVCLAWRGSGGVVVLRLGMGEELVAK